jgi:hypothetical protein
MEGRAQRYGPHKAFYSRFMRWGRLGAFDCHSASIVGTGPRLERIMIDATNLDANRTAASLHKKMGMFSVVSGEPRAG